jgi:uncharacterized protein (DUF697 family)
VTSRRDEPTGGQTSGWVGSRLGGIFDTTAGDRDGISARDVTTLLPRTMDALRSVVQRDEHGRRGIPVDKLRAIGREFVPRLPMRDASTLVRHHHGRTGEELADVLVRNASSASAMAGVVGGSLIIATKKSPQAAVVTIPIRLAAEALVIAAIEIKLVAEIHEAYGQPLGRTSGERAQGALREWAALRGIDGSEGIGMVGVLGKVMKRPAQRRAAGGMAGRLLGQKAAFLGAGIAGGAENRKETVALAAELRDRLGPPREFIRQID